MAAKHCSEPKVTDKIFGICCVFEDIKFPTKADVLKQYLYNRKSAEYHDNKTKHFQDVASAIKLLWKKTRIAIISDKAIERKLDRLFSRYRNTMKHISLPTFKYEAKNLRRTTEAELFDIAICQCLESCNCSYEYKIRFDIRDFLHDQRNARQLFIPVDIVISLAVNVIVYTCICQTYLFTLCSFYSVFSCLFNCFCFNWSLYGLKFEQFITGRAHKYNYLLEY